jgi:hypothetical protein
MPLFAANTCFAFSLSEVPLKRRRPFPLTAHTLPSYLRPEVWLSHLHDTQSCRRTFCSSLRNRNPGPDCHVFASWTRVGTKAVLVSFGCWRNGRGAGKRMEMAGSGCGQTSLRPVPILIYNTRFITVTASVYEPPTATVSTLPNPRTLVRTWGSGETYVTRPRLSLCGQKSAIRTRGI